MAKQKPPTTGNGDQAARETRTWYEELGNIFRDVIDLREGLDRYGTILSIRKNIHLKGINVWMLICAIMVASIGLDKNSPAVIIGGMLISPLMYPILGLGLSIAINDRETLVKSAENFGVAILVTLITSTIYFMLTPYGKPNVEIMARTTPDIMDVFVGFFGGIAGIVAGSRKEGTSAAIPGVAIATALLPPICVAGFGLATFNMAIFVGAFYLFVLNTFFIMIATYLVVRYLKFPYKQHTTEKQSRQARMAITVASVVIILPSFFFLKNSVNDIRTSNRVEAFVRDHLENDRIKEIGWEVKDLDTARVLEVDCYVEQRLDRGSVDSLEAILAKDYKCRRIGLKLNQIEAKGEAIREMQANQMALFTEIEKTRQAYSNLLEERDNVFGQIGNNMVRFQADSLVFNALMKELPVFYPDLTDLYAGRLLYTGDFSGRSEQFTLVLNWEKDYYQSIYRKRTEQITDFVLARFPAIDTVYIIHR